jgi:hypothetical protein
MTDQNTILLVKQLASSELEGTVRPAPAGLWIESRYHGLLCLWDEGSLHEPERLIHELAADAAKLSFPWQETLLLKAPQSQSDCVEEFIEALYVYGQSEAETPGAVPDSVMLAMSSPRVDESISVKSPVEPAEIALAEEMAAKSESMLHGAVDSRKATRAPARLLAAYKANRIIGACKCRDTELSTRITALSTSGEEVYESVAALASSVYTELNSRGGLFVHAWVAQLGQIRFALAEAGFSLAYKCTKLSGVIST